MKSLLLIAFIAGGVLAACWLLVRRRFKRRGVTQQITGAPSLRETFERKVRNGEI